MVDAEVVRQSRLFRDMASGRSDVELWDLDSGQRTYSYFSLVSRQSGSVRILAYLRVKSGSLEKRTYDENGDDLWIIAAD